MWDGSSGRRCDQGGREDVLGPGEAERAASRSELLGRRAGELEGELAVASERAHHPHAATHDHAPTTRPSWHWHDAQTDTGEEGTKQSTSVAKVLVHDPTTATTAMTGSKGKRKAVEEPSRNKIILALDQDNFYCACERVRDPSLVGKAVGIKQKGILATCSYEARALGVRKLSTIGEALRTCPDLIIVDGSDLTQYRAYSRRIFSLIRRTLGDDAPVERVGMDEVFCDVTKVVDRQWQAVEGARVGANGDSRWWALDEGGFWYDVSAPPGQLEPSDSGPSKHRPASHASPMILASHLADHLRTLIRCELGFPSSAGVGPSKMLAKLLSEKHKPEGMTTWYTTARSEQDARAEWVADVHAQKVQGFGSKVIQTIRTEIEGGHDSKPAPDAWTHPPEDPTLTLGRIRSSPRIHLDSLSEMFTPAVGKSLFDLLWAQDESEVVMSPDWPLQIGVEDSFWRLGQGKGCRWETWQGETRRLARNLVARLEGELKEDPSDAPPAKRAKTTGWLRFPAKLRTTIMLRGVGRQSKTMAMPVEVFDDAIPSEPRAEKVVDAARAMYKALVAGRKDDDVHMLVPPHRLRAQTLGLTGSAAST